MRAGRAEGEDWSGQFVFMDIFGTNDAWGSFVPLNLRLPGTVRMQLFSGFESLESPSANLNGKFTGTYNQRWARKLTYDFGSWSILSKIKEGG